jgi:hypothetical protein
MTISTDSPRRRASLRILAAATLVVLAAMALATVAEARARRPISLRIEGAFEAAPDATKPLRTIEVQIGKERSRQLAVTNLVNQGSGPFGTRILDEVARYKPAFRLLGEASQLKKLLDAPAGRRLTITGNLTSGRNVLVSMVEISE